MSDRAGTEVQTFEIVADGVPIHELDAVSRGDALVRFFREYPTLGVDRVEVGVAYYRDVRIVARPRKDETA